MSGERPTRSDKVHPSVRSFIFLFLGLGISASGVWLIARVIDPDRLARLFASIESGWLLIAALAILATYLARLRRWAVLLQPQSFRATALMLALLTGQLLNLLLPIRIGDVIRAALIGRQPGGSFARVFGSVLIEKAWDWLMLCLIVIVVALLAPLPDWFRLPAYTVGLVALGVLIGFSIIAVLPERSIAHGLMRLDRLLARWLAHWRTPIMNNIQRLLDSLTALHRRELIVGAAAWSSVIWTLGVVTNYAVMRAYGVDSWIAAMALIAVLMVGVALPPSIAAVGIWEGLTMLALSALDVPLETGLAIGLTSHVIIVLELLLGAGSVALYEIGYRHRLSLPAPKI